MPASTEPLYEPVSLESAGAEIASVAIQLGKNFGTEPKSSTGVSEGHGNTDLLVDDLTYYPPSSPPESSFRLGANPPAIATTAGNQVSVTIPVTWTNNPEPASSPVQFEASTPPGVEGTFSPNPSSSGSTTLTLKIAKNATPEQTAITVTGYVDKGLSSEKTASVEIPLGISSALELSGAPNLVVAPCTPRQVTLRVQVPSYVTEPVTIEVVTANQPGVTISSISGGSVLSPGHAEAVVSPTDGEATTTLTLSVAAGTKPAPGRTWGVFASAGEYAAQPAYGSLGIEAGSVDEADIGHGSVPAAEVDTPALHNLGSQLTLHGAGFCAGSKAAVGDDSEGVETENLATPESISGDGTSMTFRVPRGAVTGPVKILPPGGTEFEGPSLAVRSFRDTDGFSWVNKDYGLRFDDELGDELFGRDETNIEPLPGWLVRKPEAVLFEEMANKHIPGGICFGMAYSSLEFDEFPGETSRFPHTGGTDAWHMDSSSKPSEPLLRFVTENFALQFTDQLIPAEVNAVLGIHGTSDDINAIEEELAAGHPVLLGLVHFGNVLEGQSLIEGHTVLAYDSRPLPGGGTAIYVANSNVPYSTEEETNFEAHNSSQFTRSEVVIKEGNWVFPEGAEFEHSEDKPWTGSEAGMVVYRHKELPFINGERPHLPNLLTAVVMSFGSSGDGVTQLSNGHGSLFSSSGRLAPAGILAERCRAATRLRQQGEPASARLLQTRRRGSAHCHGGAGSRRRRDELQPAGAAGQSPGWGARRSGRSRDGRPPRRRDWLQNLGVSLAVRWHVALGARGWGGGGGAGSSATRASAAVKHSLSDHIVQFHTVSGQGDDDKVSFPEGHEFVLHHVGAPTSLSLTVSAFAADGRPVAVELPAIRVVGGETLKVVPASWRRLDSAPVRITARRDGHDSVRLVRGRSVGTAFAHVRKAILTNLGGEHYRLDLPLRIRRAPRQGRLSVAASLLLHGHPVGRVSANQLDGSLRHVQAVHLTVPKALKPGRYTVSLRLLEVTARGAAQGSVVVTKILSVRAG